MKPRMLYICSSRDGKTPAHVMGPRCDHPNHKGHWVVSKEDYDKLLAEKEELQSQVTWYESRETDK